MALENLLSSGQLVDPGIRSLFEKLGNGLFGMPPADKQVGNTP
jgi:hypothetical protein